MKVRDLLIENQLCAEILKKVAVPVWVFDENDRLSLFNDAAADFICIANRQRGAAGAAKHAYPPWLAPELPRAWLAGSKHVVKTLSLPAGWGMAHAEINLTIMEDAAEQFKGTIVFLTDVTDAKNDREELNNYRKLFMRARDIILFIRLDGQILDVNEAAVEAYGFTRQELLSCTIDDLRLPGSQASHHRQMLQAYEEGLEVQTVHVRKDGSTFPVEVSARGIDLAGEKAVISIARDITERVKIEAEIRYLGLHDKLTGLCNRACLRMQLGKIQELPCSIIMGDLNGLKIVNDTFGHQAGDLLLQETARILQDVCAKTGSVARIGGDEFVVLLPGADEAAARAIIEAIKNKCEQSTFEPLPPNISLGFATQVLPEQDMFQVFQEAESKMYYSKMLEGSNYYSFSIRSLLRLMHEKSFATEAHARRVQILARQLAEELQISPELYNNLDLLAVMHDIGVVAIPSIILKKSDPLDKEERAIMQKHCEVGYRIARACSELAPIAEDILSHHERWDGKGYPRGLAGEQIPLLARIIAVVGAYDDMVKGPAHKKALTAEEARQKLRDNAGSQFDPAVVAAFLQVLERLPA